MMAEMLTMRAAYGLGLGYLVYAVPQIAMHLSPKPPAMAAPHRVHAPHLPTEDTSGAAWFAETKPFCNALEAAVRTKSRPPPEGWNGAAYEAACFALAGNIAQARAVIDRQDASVRGQAAAVVFNIGHPIADAGDDASAGPIMRLVLEYWPENYQALYHAGMSEYALGDSDLARHHLRAFLAAYHQDDYFHRTAKATLEKLNP
jgi:hypothetical protein